MSFDPERSALLITDMQNGFCHPDGSLYAPASEAAIEPIADLLEGAREAGARVVFTRDVHPPEQFDDATFYDEFDRWGEHVLEDTWEAEIVDDLAVHEEDHVVDKHTYDAFYRTDLEGYLDVHGIEDLVIAGTLANVCVLHTASSAGPRDVRPAIVADALGYVEEAHRDFTLQHLDWLFGGVTTTVDEVEWA